MISQEKLKFPNSLFKLLKADNEAGKKTEDDINYT